MLIEQEINALADLLKKNLTSLAQIKLPDESRSRKGVGSNIPLEKIFDAIDADKYVDHRQSIDSQLEDNLPILNPIAMERFMQLCEIFDQEIEEQDILSVEKIIAIVKNGDLHATTFMPNSEGITFDYPIARAEGKFDIPYPTPDERFWESSNAYTLLTLAVQYCPLLAKFLLQYNYDAQSETHNKFRNSNRLSVAIAKGQTELAKLFVTLGGDPHAELVTDKIVNDYNEILLSNAQISFIENAEVFNHMLTKNPNLCYQLNGDILRYFGERLEHWGHRMSTKLAAFIINQLIELGYYPFAEVKLEQNKGCINTPLFHYLKSCFGYDESEDDESEDDQPENYNPIDLNCVVPYIICGDIYQFMPNCHQQLIKIFGDRKDGLEMSLPTLKNLYALISSYQFKQFPEKFKTLALQKTIAVYEYLRNRPVKRVKHSFSLEIISLKKMCTLIICHQLHFFRNNVPTILLPDELREDLEVCPLSKKAFVVLLYNLLHNKVTHNFSPKCFDTLQATLHNLRTFYPRFYFDLKCLIGVNDTTINFLNTLSHPISATRAVSFVHLIEDVTKNGIIAILESPEYAPAEKIFEKYDWIFNDKKNERLTNLVNRGQHVHIPSGLDRFQPNIAASQGYKKYCSYVLRFSSIFTSKNKLTNRIVDNDTPRSSPKIVSVNFSYSKTWQI